VIRMPKLQEIIEKEGIEKKLKLVSSLSGNNFVLFNSKGKIQRYQDEREIMEEFFGLREKLYTKRKEF